MYFFSIVLTHALTACIVWIIVAYLVRSTLQKELMRYRSHIVANQIFVAIFIDMIAKLLSAIGLQLIGKITGGILSAIVVYFVWENINNWSFPKLQKSTREVGSVIVGLFMVVSVISSFL